jgi:hypothetical protein
MANQATKMTSDSLDLTEAEKQQKSAAHALEAPPWI